MSYYADVRRAKKILGEMVFSQKMSQISAIIDHIEDVSGMGARFVMPRLQRWENLGRISINADFVTNLEFEEDKEVLK